MLIIYADDVTIMNVWIDDFLNILVIEIEFLSGFTSFRYLQERMKQVEDEKTHAMATIAKYKVFDNYYCCMHFSLVLKHNLGHIWFDFYRE